MIGLVFWVRADEVGQAATLAIETARRAGEKCGVGPELYEVVVLPSSAVRHPGEGDPRLFTDAGLKVRQGVIPEHWPSREC